MFDGELALLFHVQGDVVLQCFVQVTLP